MTKEQSWTEGTANAQPYQDRLAPDPPGPNWRPPVDWGMVCRIKDDIASIESGLLKSEWDEGRLPALRRMLERYGQ